MKKHFAVLLPILCLVLFSGCGTKYPAQTSLGEPWDESWEILGSTLGVEEPGGGFVLLDNNSILTAQDTYLATWVHGDPVDYLTADGEDAKIYEAELFLLLQGCKDNENAQIAVNAWIDLANESYSVSKTWTETHGGQEYTILTYTVASGTNPYSRGISAYAIFENYAMSAELACLDSYAGDIAALLTDFLDGCHYASTGS